MADPIKCQEYLDNIRATEAKIELNIRTMDNLRDKISNLQLDNILLRQDINRENDVHKDCNKGGSVNRKYIRKPKSRSSRTRRTNYRKKTTRRRR